MGGGRSSRGPGDASSRPNHDTTAGLTEQLSRFGATELGCLCSLAVAARPRCGDRPVRIELAGSGAEGQGRNRPRSSSSDDHDGARLPIRGPCATGPTDAWLVVEPGGDGSSPPDLDALGRLAASAGLMLERHRLDRDARRARQALEEARSTLAHGLRGHLHNVLIRTDTLLLGVQKGKMDAEELSEGLGKLRKSLIETTSQIRELLERPDAGAESAAGATDSPDQEVRIPELLREMGESPRLREGFLAVEIDGDVPALRIDRSRLASGLEDLFALARRSPDSATLTVRPDAASAGVRLELRLEPPSPSAADGPSGERGGSDGASGSSESDGGTDDERPGLSLRELSDAIGGRLRIETGTGTEVAVVVVLPRG